MPACGSPWLFAAYHVFLRRPVPWHPPCALCNLIVTKLSSCQSFYFDSLFLRPTAKLFSQLVSYKMFSIWLCSFQGALQGSFLRSLKTIQAQEETVNLPALRRTSFFPPQSPAASTWNESLAFASDSLPRKEVIQPHLPIRLPCYDFTPVIGLTFDGWLLSVTSPASGAPNSHGVTASGAPNSHGVTGGVYKARERIHRGMLIRDY